MEKHACILEKKTDSKMYDYLSWFYYFVTVIINIIINLNMLDIDVFSPAGNEHQVNIFIIIITLKTKEKVNLYYAGSLYQ